MVFMARAVAPTLPGMAGVDQDETGLHRRPRPGRTAAGKLALVAVRIAARPALLFLSRPDRLPIVVHHQKAMPFLANLHPMISVAAKAARIAGNLINRAALDVELIRVSKTGQ